MALYDMAEATDPVRELDELQRQHEELERQNKHIRRQLRDLLQRDCKRLSEENVRMTELLNRVEAHWIQPASVEEIELERVRYERQQLEAKRAEIAALGR